MNKKLLIIIIVVVLLIGLGIGGFFYWKGKKAKTGTTVTPALENAGDAAQKITDTATQGTLPSIGTNPLESKPDVNPADKANPYTNIKTNPF